MKLRAFRVSVVHLPLRLLLASTCLTITLPACDGKIPGGSLNRMIDQYRYKTYSESDEFADHRVMRTPPAGTVRRDAPRATPTVTGESNGEWVAAIPLPVTRALAERGRDRFDVYCAVCHGLAGDGDSEVARNMELRRPPSLLKPTFVAYPPGRVFHVISEGYGLMPSYARDLPIEDRWAIVAYLRALQISQSVRLADLPPIVRRNAEEALK